MQCNISIYNKIVTESSKPLNNLKAKQFKESGDNLCKRRCGSRIKPKDNDTSNSMIYFKKSLKCCESHYGRGKSVFGYLSPELSIKRLWRKWKEQQVQQNKPLASYSKLLKGFQTKFNLGFNNPKTDVFSFCDLTKSQIRASNDLREKASLMTKI